MKIWITIEPNQAEIDNLLSCSNEGVSQTPLKSTVYHAHELMKEHEVSLKVTTMKWEPEK